MRSHGVGAAVLALLLTGASHAGATIEATATLDPFGEVELYQESTNPTRLVLLLSDANGWAYWLPQPSGSELHEIPRAMSRLTRVRDTPRTPRCPSA